MRSYRFRDLIATEDLPEGTPRSDSPSEAPTFTSTDLLLLQPRGYQPRGPFLFGPIIDPFDALWPGPHHWHEGPLMLRHCFHGVRSPCATTYICFCPICTPDNRLTRHLTVRVQTMNSASTRNDLDRIQWIMHHFGSNRNYLPILAPLPNVVATFEENFPGPCFNADHTDVRTRLWLYYPPTAATLRFIPHRVRVPNPYVDQYVGLFEDEEERLQAGTEPDMEWAEHNLVEEESGQSHAHDLVPEWEDLSPPPPPHREGRQ